MPRYKSRVQDTNLQEYVRQRNAKRLIRLGLVKQVVMFNSTESAKRFALRNKNFRVIK